MLNKHFFLVCIGIKCDCGIRYLSDIPECPMRRGLSLLAGYKTSYPKLGKHNEIENNIYVAPAIRNIVIKNKKTLFARTLMSQQPDNRLTRRWFYKPEILKILIYPESPFMSDLKFWR
jgi:hypothetical protein